MFYVLIIHFSILDFNTNKTTIFFDKLCFSNDDDDITRAHIYCHLIGGGPTLDIQTYIYQECQNFFPSFLILRSQVKNKYTSTSTFSVCVFSVCV